MSDYFWCLHCERVSLRSSWITNHWCCPFPDCDGGYGDAWDWDEYFYERGYEKCPILGSFYPLYPLDS